MRVSAWLDLRGRVDATFINTGSEARRHGLTDDSALSCVPRMPPPSPTSDVPGRALAWQSLLAFNYQSAGIEPDCMLQLEWHPCTPTMSASSLAPTCCIMTTSTRLMRLKGSNLCLIPSAAFMDGNNGVCLLFLSKEKPFLFKVFTATCGGHLVVNCLMHIAHEYRRLIRWNELL